MARISTHVLDIAAGKPAEGISVELYRCGAQRQLLTSAFTNSEGRTDQPLASANELAPGEYELLFHVGGYLPRPSFYGEIAIRFQVIDPCGNYHVPLLLAPHGYSTYRGS